MVVLGAELRLLSVDATFLGLMKGRRQGEIVVTTTNSVVLFEVESHTPLISWNTLFADDHVAVTPCSYDSSNSCFITAFQNKVIRSWSPNDDKIDCGQKFEVALPINVVIPFLNDDAGAVIIYENGDISFLHDHATIIPSDVSHGSSIKSPWTFSGESGNCLGFLSICEEEILLHHLSFDDKYQKKSHDKFPVYKAGLTLMDAHAYASKTSLEISLIWSDKSVSHGTYSFTKKEISWKSYPPLKDICCHGALSITSCHDDIIVAFIRDDGDAMYICYNLKYKAITAKEVIKVDEKVTEIHLFNVCERIYLQLGNDIMLLPYTSSKLSAVLGVGVDGHVEKAAGLDSPLLWSSSGLESQSHLTGSLDQRDDISKRFLTLVIDQENLGKSEQAMCFGMLKEFQQAKDFEMLLEALKYFRNISEESLVDCLLCYLSHEIKCGNILHDGTNLLEADCQRRYPFVDQILMIQINEIFLLDHLRKLPLDEAVWMMWYLRDLLCHDGSSSPSNGPNISQVVDWISMLLDAHFHQFFLLKNDSLDLFLRCLSSLVLDQVLLIEDQCVVHDLIKLLLRKRKEYEKEAQRMYCIETLIL